MNAQWKARLIPASLALSLLFACSGKTQEKICSEKNAVADTDVLGHPTCFCGGDLIWNEELQSCEPDEPLDTSHLHDLMMEEPVDLDVFEAEEHKMESEPDARSLRDPLPMPTPNRFD
jgi:hypothetical protein